MKYKFILLIFISMVLSISTCVSALDVTPQILTIDGSPGSFQIRTITLENKENASVNVTIAVSPLIGSYYLPLSSYKLDPYESKMIQFGMTINSTMTATITYFYGNDYFTQIVMINATRKQPTILLAPSTPQAGKGVTVMLISSRLLDAQGMVICSETDNRYPFTIDKGIGTFKLNTSEEEGTAIMRLISNDFEPIFYSFNITGGTGSEPTEPELCINVSQDVDIGTSKIVTLKLDDNPVEGTFIITKPNGNQELKTTDSKGRISIEFDLSGLWTLNAESGDYTVTKGVRVAKQSIEIELPHTDVVTGKACQIQIEPSMTCDISSDTKSYTFLSDNSGIVRWTPEYPGLYTIDAYNDEGSGTAMLEVWQFLDIRVTQGSYNTGTLQKGLTTDVMVVDDSGEVVSSIDSIEITDTKNFPVTVDLHNGKLSWIPEKTGVYTLKVYDDEENYILGDFKSVQVADDSGGGGWGWGYYALAVLVLFVILVILVGLHRSGKEGEENKPSGKVEVTERVGLIKRVKDWRAGGLPFWHK